MTSVRIRFLGTGDAFGSGGRMQTCILLEAGEHAFLVDCGASSLISLKRAGVDPGGIEAVLISHLHGDHFGGLPFLVLDRQFSGKPEPLTIVGPPGLESRVTGAMEILFPGLADVQREFQVDFQELSEGQSSAVGPLRLTPYEVVHPCGAPPYALRIEIEGRVIAYSGDTGWTERLVGVAKGADLFICESNFYEKKVPFHLDYLTLNQHLPELDCKRIVLTHMGPEMLQHLEDLELEAAWDGLELSL